MISAARSIRFLFIVFITVALGACSSGSDGTSSNFPIDNIDNIDDGALLEGSPTALASSATRDFDSGDRTSEDEISIDTDGARIDRTNLDVTFVDTATIGEINALLESVDGKIVNMLAGVNVLLIKIPDPGDLIALEEIVARLESEPLVVEVSKAYMAETDSLPENYDWFISPLSPIDHHIAAIAPAAWNAKEALYYDESTPPLLLVGDKFGDGVPNIDFDLNILEPADFTTGSLNSHGYHVLGIISGLHNTIVTDKSPRQIVTGIYPDTLDLRTVDYLNFNLSAGENEILKIIKNAGTNVVLSTSLSYPCGTPPAEDCARKNARRWLQKVRGVGLYLAGAPGGMEFNFLHLTAAANFKGGADNLDAKVVSAWATSRLMSGLKNELSINMVNLTNTLVVENRTNTTAPHSPGCLNASSKYSGDISGMGTEVWSLTGANNGAGNKTGTSMATPQVAGLAAYIWALNPSLTPQQVLERLQKTSRVLKTDESCSPTPQPVIDAYAAVLAADDQTALDKTSGDPFNAPARLAVLDVADSGGELGADDIFDSHDLQMYIYELETRGGLNLDYSRFDLNGDGYTGGVDRKARFNLDIDYPPTYKRVMQDIYGQTTELNEAAVTDWQVLCYYAYSPLYIQDTAEQAMRDTLLAPHMDKCGQGVQKIVFISNRLSYDDVYVMNPDGSGQTNLTPEPGDNLRPIWSPDGTKIAYESNAWSGEIWTMDADGTNKKNITDNDPLYDGSPAWSPDGSQIAYLSGRDDWHGDVWLMKADGSGKTNLTYINDPSLPQQPSDSQPAWSPDGSKIAFISDRDGSNDFYLIDVSSGGITRLTTEAKTTAANPPTWSPDGTKIAFWSFRDGGLGDIFVMNSDGSGQTNITNSKLDDTPLPLWSPDGTKILFESKRGGSYTDIWVMDADGSNQTNLTSGSGTNNWDPIWSPDGQLIIFNSTRVLPQRRDIWVMDADGSNQTNLTNAAGDDFTPDW